MAKNNKRFQRIREWALYQLLTPIRWIFEAWMERRNLVVLYCVIGNGIGDALALSTILNALNKDRGFRGIVFSMCPDLFLHNPMVIKNLGYHQMSSLRRSLLKTLFRNLRGPYCICFGGEVWTLNSSPLSTSTIDDQRIPGIAWINRLLPDGKLNLSLVGAKPAIFFSQAEHQACSQKFQELRKPFGLIKATIGLNRPKSTALKDWSIEGFAQMVQQCSRVTWVQVGEKGEPALPGAINLLGATSLRELLWLLSQSRILVSVEGFLTHASAAFDVSTVVPFTGIHDPAGLLYPCTIPVLPDPVPSCMPCWQEECTTEGMPCRKNISQEQMVAAVSKALLQGSPT